MSRDNTQFDSSELLNSSFYSSNSINALEHSRTFRNSLLLKEMSDTSIAISTSSLNSRSGSPSKAKESVAQEQPTIALDQKPKNKDEVRTVNMTTSPSLSALAEILNEKSRDADKKMRISRVFEDSIIEEDEEEQEPQNDLLDMQSPNLIDLGDSPNGTHFAKVAPPPPSYTSVSDQPDFMTTPKVSQQTTPRQQHLLSNYAHPQNMQNIQEVPTEETAETVVEEEEVEEKQHVPEAVIVKEKETPLEKKLPTPPAPHTTTKHKEEPAVRSNSYADIMKGMKSKKNQAQNSKLNVKKTREATKTEPVNIAPEVAAPQKKKKGLFSFLKRKTDRSVSATVQSTSSKAKEETVDNTMPSSATFSHLSTNKPTVTNDTSKITQKSHSSNSIFNNLRRKSAGPDTLDVPKSTPKQESKPVITTEPSEISNASVLSGVSAESTQFKTDATSVEESPVTSPEEVVNTHSTAKRNPTPLNFEEAIGSEDIHHQTQTTTPNIQFFDQPPSIEHSDKRDSGEAFFPKLLDADEIENIVKLERNRSQRSGSIRRRASMDTLSINAQNEGMTVHEASGIVLSTPDLTKSPAGSILRSGRFDQVDTFPTNDFGSKLDSQDLSLTTEDSNNQLFASMEEKLDQLTNDYNNENVSHSDIDILQTKNKREVTSSTQVDNDPELMSDIMEFADLINFGDGIDLDVDINQEAVANDDEVFHSTLAPTYADVSGEPEDADSYTEDDYEKFMSSEQEGLGITVEHDDVTDNLLGHTNFEDEDFNDDDEQEYDNSGPYHVNRSILDDDFEDSNRPISMSFRGLTGPSLNDTSAMENENDFGIEAEEEEEHAGTNVKFSSEIILFETYGEFEYDRHPDIGTCNQLTPQLAQMIKAELNELKSTMEVHESSQCYTQYF